MKKIINKKVYDTEKAKLVAKYSNGLPISNFKHVYEDLYVTKKGQFFLHVQGGPLTIYSEKIGSNTYGVEDIILLSEDEAYKWLEKNNEIEAIKKYFDNEIEEG